MNSAELAQGTEEWIQARCGNVTASRIADMMAELKGGKGESASRRNYRAELVCELLTGKVQKSYCSLDMQRGIDLEPLARAAYEVRQGVMVDQVGFILHPTVPRSGSSPDGLVAESGMVEVKCPKAATHIDYLLAGVAPSDYQLQMLWQMACCEREWVDFISYHPDLPEELQLFVVRFPRDNDRITKIEKAVIEFTREIDETISRLRCIR